jgi:hypothetical protein
VHGRRAYFYKSSVIAFAIVAAGCWWRRRHCACVLLKARRVMLSEDNPFLTLAFSILRLLSNKERHSMGLAEFA